jgi:hypothetical protein
MQARSQLLLIPHTMTRNITQAWSQLQLIPHTMTRNVRWAQSQLLLILSNMTINGTGARARLIPLKNLQWTFLTLKSVSELTQKSLFKKPSNICGSRCHMSQPGWICLLRSIASQKYVVLFEELLRHRPCSTYT